MLLSHESLDKLANSRKSFEFSILWWLAAGISVTLMWLPILNAALCLVFFLCWLLHTRLRFSIQNIPQLVLFISVYILTAMSFFYSVNTREALRILQLKLPLLLFPLIFASGITWEKRQIRLLLLLFSWSVAVFCIITITHAIGSAFSTRSLQALFGYNIIPFDYVYASVASLFCVAASTIQLYEMTEQKKLLFRHLFPLLLFWMLLFLLSNRMGLFLNSIITFFFLIRTVQSVVTKVLTVACILSLLTGFYFLNGTFREKVKLMVQFNPGQMIELDKNASLGRTWDGLQLRLAIWKCASGIIQSHFWTGVGVGDAQQTLQETYEQRQFYFASRYNRYNAHNQFIEQWLITGVAGAVLFFLSLVIPLWQSLRSGQLMYAVFLIVFICFSFTESLLEVSKGVVWFSFFNSIFAFQESKNDT